MDGRGYRKTVNGLVATIIGAQRQGSKKRNHPQPEWDFQELLDFLLSQDSFNELYLNWVASGYKRDLKPSIDRIDARKPYTWDNIQLMTLKENLYVKGPKDAFEKRSVKVTGEFPDGKIEHFNSVKEAGEITGTYTKNISSCLTGSRPKAGGIKWRYT